MNNVGCEEGTKTCDNGEVRSRNPDNDCKFECKNKKAKDETKQECPAKIASGIAQIRKDAACPSKGKYKLFKNKKVTLANCVALCGNDSECYYISWGEGKNNLGTCTGCKCGSTFKNTPGTNCYGSGGYDPRSDIETDPPTTVPTPSPVGTLDPATPYCENQDCVRMCNDGTHTIKNRGNNCNYDECASGNKQYGLGCSKGYSNYKQIGNNLRCKPKDGTFIASKVVSKNSPDECHKFCVEDHTASCSFFSYKARNGECLLCRCAAEWVPGFQVKRNWKTYAGA